MKLSILTGVKRPIILVCVALALGVMSRRGVAEIVLAEQGRARCIILLDPASSPPEQNAARELATVLQQITKASFEIKTNATAPENSILVGGGEAARALFPEVPFGELASEEFVIKTKGSRLLLAGGRPRGTLYAVSHFLQSQCGVRWWTAWAARIPAQETLRLAFLDLREKPAFESRDPYWYCAFDPAWAWHNRANSEHARLTPELGDAIRYKGFVHTFEGLVPAARYFGEHPEWFSLIKGKRTAERSQLCLTNPKLRDFMVERVKEWLRESPNVVIVSVSQNDWHGACECPDCKALDDAEGTHAATMLTLVNYIAEKIQPEFPGVAVDTLAYQYTRKPPKTIKPRPNVIVRLCSIECNFREPLDHPSNAAFADDIRGWSKLCQRLYIWDYTTDFAHYVLPHPNWFTLGPNLRFFANNGVQGVFEQGAYQSHGGEMAELRAWVLAQLLWNPKLDDRALIEEFLQGYYGPEAAPHLRRYLELMHESSKGHNLTCYSGLNAPHLKFQPILKAERLWEAAEKACANQPEFLDRVRVGHLPVRYAWLSRWDALQKEAETAGQPWPFQEPKAKLAADWVALASGAAGKPWTRVVNLSEGGLTPEKWAAKFINEPAKP